MFDDLGSMLNDLRDVPSMFHRSLDNEVRKFRVRDSRRHRDDTSPVDLFCRPLRGLGWGHSWYPA
jgi:hypothetical protein